MSMKLKKQADNIKAKRIESWSMYIHKILKEVHQDNFTLSVKTMRIMNHFMDDIFERLASEMYLLLKRHKKKTVSPEDVQAAVQLVIPGELAHHAISEGNKAVQRYYCSVEE